TAGAPDRPHSAPARLAAANALVPLRKRAHDRPRLPSSLPCRQVGELPRPVLPHPAPADGPRSPGTQANPLAAAHSSSVCGRFDCYRALSSAGHTVRKDSLPATGLTLRAAHGAPV